MCQQTETKEGTSEELTAYMMALLKLGRPVVAFMSAGKITIIKECDRQKPCVHT